MPRYGIVENKSAELAQSTLRILGIALNVIGGLVVCISILAIGISRGPSGIGGRGPSGTAIAMSMLLVAAMYLAPGITLVVLSRQVGEHRRGSTIAALVIAIVVALFMLMGVVLAVRSLLAQSTPGMVVNLILSVVLGLVATLASIFCGKSLAWMNHSGPLARGFEPELTTPTGRRPGSR